VAVTLSFAYLVYYMRFEGDRILTSSSHVGNESRRQGSENRPPLLTKEKFFIFDVNFTILSN